MAITFFVMAPKILLGIAVPIRHHPPVSIVWLPQFGYEQIVRPPLSQVSCSPRRVALVRDGRASKTVIALKPLD
jgi:hypothetical protein